jgi:hypothetical protein
LKSFFWQMARFLAEKHGNRLGLLRFALQIMAKLRQNKRNKPLWPDSAAFRSHSPKQRFSASPLPAGHCRC